MQVHRLAHYQQFLGGPAIARLAQQALEVQALERRFETRAVGQLELELVRVMNAFEQGREIPADLLAGLEQVLFDQALEVIDQGLNTAEESMQDLEDRPPTQRLAKKPPRLRIPRKMDDLRRFWDRVRRQQQGKPEGITDRARSIFDSVREEYLKKLQQVWRKYGADWREGRTGSKERAIEAMQKATGSTRRRVRTIIETETTYYYNTTREAYYSKADVVTHYLFLAVRDHATTQWCRSRHGKVFEKGTTLFLENIPPCHWNCRSEIVPLTPFNPRHKLLIEDKSKRATRGNIVPLPPGWGRRTG